MSIQLATLDPRQVRLDQLKAETNTESLTSVPFSQPARAKVALDMRPARENPMDRHSSRHAPARAISNATPVSMWMALQLTRTAIPGAVRDKDRITSVFARRSPYHLRRRLRHH
jgi:hypothetical protein